MLPKPPNLNHMPSAPITNSYCLKPSVFKKKKKKGQIGFRCVCALSHVKAVLTETRRGERSDPLKLELQVEVSCYRWELGT